MIEDEDDVYYCSNCGSLAIKEENDILYCNKCNCAVIEKGSMKQWENYMKKKNPKFRPLISRDIFDYEKFQKQYNNDYYKK